MTKLAFVWKIRFISFTIVLVSLLFGARLFQLQIVRGEELLIQAERQYQTPRALYNRGSIHFSRKSGTILDAAGIKSGYTLAINPSVISDPEAVYQGLSGLLLLDHDDYMSKVARKDDPYEEILTRLDGETAEAVSKLALEGVMMVRDQWRHYPGGKLSAHVLGFVGFSKDQYNGRYGVERFRERTLERRPESAYSNFFAEVFTGIGATVFEKESKRPGNVVLTIEPTVQAVLEDSLEAMAELYRVSDAGAIVINPSSGAITAMAAFPSFDPNRYGDVTNVATFSNPLVESVHEPGSIMKPITIASALDAGVITADSKYYDAGFVEISDVRIENYDGKGRGWVKMQEILNQSLNTGSVYISKELGPERLRSYFEKFGFREPTGIDLPNEVGNLDDNLDSNQEVDFASISFGQAIAISPISMVRALGALANGGYLIKPHVTKEIDYGLAGTEEVLPVEQGRVISRKTSDEITRMLVRVVDEALLGGSVAMPRYSISAKTGTGEIANLETGGYSKERFHHSFFGYFPAYEPRYLIYFFANEPKGVRYASQTLTKPFMDMVQFLISYYDIPPDR